MLKKIAWGTSKLLKMYLEVAKENPFAYCIDDCSTEERLYDIPIKKSDSILQEEPGTFQLIIFAVSNRSLQEISKKLNSYGLVLGKDFIFYSDFFYDNFLSKVESHLGFSLNPRIYKWAFSYTLNSRALIHTTILGTWLFLELLKRLNEVDGQIAEVGAFQGGNALCALHFMTNFNPKKFYIFDSFEGFPELSKNDPSSFQKGDYNTETTFQEILDTFSHFPEARVIKGFVPKTFTEVPKNEKFSLVFYDCDIYQPVLDTFEFFWEKIVPGGYLVVHDYESEENEFAGVRKATEEFFQPKKITFPSFFENTMAVIKK